MLARVFSRACLLSYPPLPPPSLTTPQRPERLFEEEVTWEDACDKGDNSGLVMYTDGLFWNARRGDFDERTADDWGIDHSLATEKGM